MGPVGKVIPKPLWPVFEKTMLEIQLAYAKSLGCENFYSNTHHLAEQIERKNIANQLNIALIHERELLGNGGNFHHLKARFPYLNKTLVMNPDVFLMMSERDWAGFLKKASKGSCLLLMSCEGGYNEVFIDESDNFLCVKPPSEGRESYLTYTGLSVIDLDSFPLVSGSSSFFETVVNPKINKTLTYIPKDPFEYWDFGTKELFEKGLRRLLSVQSGQFWDFLSEKALVFKENADDDSYIGKSGLLQMDASTLAIRESKEKEIILL